MAARTFNELSGADSDWCTTLAYWLGPYSGTLDAQGLLGVAGAMSFQYDFEEQADVYGRALPENEEWPKLFKPVAPVQLALGWSPLPWAADVLGDPTVEAVESSTGTRMVAAGWAGERVAGVKTTVRHSTTADEKRFLGLLTVTVTRAQQGGKGLLIVAKPGWSYEHVHGVSRHTARLMNKAGFVVTTRRP
jgi:hypothetical protein